jgi:secreted trypsin-like serine protease
MTVSLDRRGNMGAAVVIGSLALAILAASPAGAADDLDSRGVGRSDLGAASEPAFPVEPTIDDLVAAQRHDDRIVGGAEAAPGQWPSVVAIYLRRPGQPAFNFCGGSLIGREWVLTAAHCGAAMKHFQSEEARSSFFVREGTSDLGSGKGHDLNVASIIMHEGYNPQLTLNDVALLRLAGQASSPRQKLLGKTRVADALHANTMSTVTGFGLTQEGGRASARLRQIDIPIVAMQDCQTVYGAQAITDANFCAGDKAGGKDSCQGDSGGPLFVPDRNGESLQAGIVSWGKGCARPGFYGVYASVGNFESWVKARVRDATFVEATDTSSDPTNQAVDTLTSGATDASKPSQLAQVTIDIAEGGRVKVGSFIEVRITSSVPGAVVVFNQNPDGHAYQLYPSKVFPAPDGNPSVAHIEPGKLLSIPSPVQRDQGYRFVIRPPTGTNHLRAIVVPDSKKMRQVIAEHSDGGEIRDLALVINQIVDTELETRGPEPVKVEPVDRGSAEKIYEIIE